MVRILFFSRLRLTELYAKLDAKLKNTFECLHVAYDKYEEDILTKKYHIPVKYNMQSHIKNFKYQPTENDLYMLDETISKFTNDRFNLNSAIQFDRGLRLLTMQEGYYVAYAYYKFWDDLLKKEKIDYIFHETTSLFFNFIASVLATKYNVIYTDMIELPYQQKGFAFLSSSNGESLEFNKAYKLQKIDLNLIKDFDSFVQNKYKTIAPLKLKQNFFKTILSALKNELAIVKSYIVGNKHKIYNNIDFYILKNRKEFKRMINLIFYKFIKWDVIDDKDVYYFYPMHIEPEAVVQYWGDGIYENQIKLLENIASQLPIGRYLYVKDHVVDYGYRSFFDYYRLKKIPNIKLIKPSIRATEVIKKAKSIITINGTAGLEAMFFHKVVYTLGHIFYNESRNVYYIHNIKDLKRQLYREYDFDIEEYKIFITSYLSSIHKGDVAWFTGGGEESKDNSNIDNIAIAIKDFIHNTKNVE